MILEPLIRVLQNFGKLKELDMAGNRLGIKAAEAMKEVLTSVIGLEKVNLSETLFQAEPAKRVFEGLFAALSLKFLNLSGNMFSSIDKEFGSRIGRLVQVSTNLTHLDIRFCKLSREEVLYLTLCLRDSLSLMSVHMGHNSVDHQTRLLARRILSASVKQPFRSAFQVLKCLTTAEDKNLVLTLNAYIMGGLPTQYGYSAPPVANQEDLEIRLERLLLRPEEQQRHSDDPFLERLL